MGTELDAFNGHLEKISQKKIVTKRHSFATMLICNILTRAMVYQTTSQSSNTPHKSSSLAMH